MASCTQIGNILQAYIDGELGDSERVILEQHTADCRACAGLLRRHQRSSAFLFEAFDELRLEHDLSEQVMEHLPEMKQTEDELRVVNWRAKHPVNLGTLFARYALRGAFTVVAILGLTLLALWPQEPVADGAIGVAVHSNGAVLLAANTQGPQVAVSDFVMDGQSYVTPSGATLMLTLKGPTHVKLDENSRIAIQDERFITLLEGKIWLDVSPGSRSRQFQVRTPTADVKVTGTKLGVEVISNKTVVTLEKGNVWVQNDMTFSHLEPGQQVEIPRGEQQLTPHNIDVRNATAWARRITADGKASDLFTQQIQNGLPDVLAPSLNGQTRTGERPYRIPLKVNDRVKSILLTWKVDATSTGHCSYDVFVSDGSSNRPLFAGKVDADTFNDKEREFYEVFVPGDEPLTGVAELSVMVFPDYEKGTVETQFEQVDGIIDMS